MDEHTDSESKAASRWHPDCSDYERSESAGVSPLRHRSFSLLLTVSECSHCAPFSSRPRSASILCKYFSVRISVSISLREFVCDYFSETISPRVESPVKAYCVQDYRKKHIVLLLFTQRMVSVLRLKRSTNTFDECIQLFAMKYGNCSLSIPSL